MRIQLSRQSVRLSALSFSLSLFLGGVTRQGVVLTVLQSLLDFQYNFSLSLSLFLSPLSSSLSSVLLEGLSWRNLRFGVRSGDALDLRYEKFQIKPSRALSLPLFRASLFELSKS